MRSSETGTVRRVAPIHALFGTAVLGLLVMPIAFAGAKSPTAAAIGSTRAQIKSLKRRVAALESKSTPTSLPPSGPAGGALTGSYPNPELGPDTVGRDQIVDGSVDEDEIGNGGVDGLNILDGSVGASDLKSTYERVSGPTQLAANTFGDATASCNAGDHVLGGGFAWQNDAGIDQRNPNNNNVTSSDVTFSTPNRSDNQFGDNPDQWIVRARSNVANDLFAWAVCLRD